MASYYAYSVLGTGEYGISRRSAYKSEAIYHLINPVSSGFRISVVMLVCQTLVG